MPEEIAGNSGTEGGSESATGGLGTEGTTSSTSSTFDWGNFRASLGDLGKEKSLDAIFASEKPGEALTKSYVEGQKMIGSSIRLPGKDAKPEDKQKFLGDITNKLREAGLVEPVPESPDKYEIKLPQTEGFQPNEPLINGFKEIAHKLQLLPSKAQAVADWYLNMQEAQDAAEYAEFQEMKEGLKKEWGGVYTRRMEAARRAAAKYIGVDGDSVISQLPPAIGKRIVMAFAEIGDPLLEASFATGGIPGMVTKEQIKGRIDAMMNDPKHPLNDISHRQHEEAVKEYSGLQQDYIRLGGTF